MFCLVLTYRVPSFRWISYLWYPFLCSFIILVNYWLKSSEWNESKSLKLSGLMLIGQNFIISALGVLCNSQFFSISYTLKKYLLMFLEFGSNEWKENFFSVSVNDLLSITGENIKLIKTFGSPLQSLWEIKPSAPSQFYNILLL